MTIVEYHEVWGDWEVREYTNSDSNPAYIVVGYGKTQAEAEAIPREEDHLIRTSCSQASCEECSISIEKKSNAAFLLEEETLATKEHQYGDPLICSCCGDLFEEPHTPERALLDAIFCNTDHYCPNCHPYYPLCTKCQKEEENPIYYENKPYHPECLPYA